MFENFGTIIQSLRKEHNMSQEDLARKLEISLSTVSRWERNSGVIPATKSLLDICYLFGTSLNTLAGMNEEQTIAIDMLTEEQQSLLKILVVEFQSRKKGEAALSARQNDIIRLLFTEFKK